MFIKMLQDGNNRCPIAKDMLTIVEKMHNNTICDNPFHCFTAKMDQYRIYPYKMPNNLRVKIFLNKNGFKHQMLQHVNNNQYQKGTRRHQGQQGMCPPHYQTILVILSYPFLSKIVQGVAKTLPIFENNHEQYHAF